MSKLSGYVRDDELKEIKKRSDITIIKDEKEKHELGNHWVELEADWGVLEFLKAIDGEVPE